ncbi:hypothetical protein HJC23_000074 [Cyclotella cryptica]|uniref:Uncharacterized protein n=1 Tax=Cyclotella cryptica TaxID=29204 RepID=A0ABD3PIP1_9STRA
MFILSDAVAMGRSILSQLDHGLPNSITVEDIMLNTKQTQNILSNISDSSLGNYENMTDKRHIMAMKCLAKLELLIYLVNPDLQPLITLKMVNISIDHGMCSTSPIGFAYFGGMLVKLGEMSDGYRFSKLAKVLLEKGGRKEIAGDVIWTTSEVLSYYEPFQTVNKYRVHGQITALAAGDVQSACALKMSYCTTLLWAGFNLKTVQEALSDAGCYMRAQNNLSLYSLMQLVQQSVLVLLGEADKFEVAHSQLTNPIEIVVFCICKIYLSLVLNAYDDVRQCAENFLKFRGSYWFANSSRAVMEFFMGLAAFRIYRETGEAQWLERGKQSKSMLQLWAEKGSMWNFQHKHILLEAEDLYSTCDFVNARLAYRKAITVARMHKYIHDEALACELAGYFYLRLDMATESLQHFTFAHEKYVEWGAVSKVDQINVFMQETFSSVNIASLGSNMSTSVTAHEQNCNNSQDSRKRRVP